MQYENPHIPEGINTSKEHPLKDFMLLLVGTIALVLVAAAVLGVGGGWLASKIPFSVEARVAAYYDDEMAEEDSGYAEITTYLQALTDKISAAQNLPAEMEITAHYLDDDTVNAFATLGGHIFIYRGLLEMMPDENTLVTLLGHEIAHVKYRHPIKSLGGGMLVGVALSAITGNDAGVMGDAGMLTVLKFGREMEQKSDEEAAATLQALYGHLNGGAALFEVFQEMRDGAESAETSVIFSTHPLDADRIANFTTVALRNGWDVSGELTPLPDFFDTALEGEYDSADDSGSFKNKPPRRSKPTQKEPHRK